ncbi:unnamed protein product [Lupinus luteus]
MLRSEAGIETHQLVSIQEKIFHQPRLGSLSLSFPCLPWALHPSSQVIRYRKFCRRVSHASCFSESVPSVSQSRLAIKRGNLTLDVGRVPLFPVRESPSALTGRARILMSVPCCSPLPEAKDGVEPSFQDLQSDTFPLCYPAKQITPHVPKSNGCSSFPAPSFSTYAVAGGALYMTGGGLPEKRG